MPQFVNAPVMIPMQDARGQVKQVPGCPNCQMPLGRPSAFQGPDNQWYKRVSCGGCGTLISMEGPYPTASQANPVEFR